VELTHLVTAVGDRATACGLRDKSRPRAPFLLADFMAAHEAGHARTATPLEWCPECLAALKSTARGEP
jgi:hypothetical protein